MTSFIDIGPLTEKVTVRGKDYDVRGVTNEEFFELCIRFPEFNVMVNGTKKQKTEQAAARLFSELPAVAAAIIAACVTDKWADPAEEAAARKLPMSAQLKFLNAAIRVSFEDGIGPFVEMASGLMNMLTIRTERVETSDSEQASTEASPVSLDVDTLERMRGRTRRARSQRTGTTTSQSAALN